MNTIKKFAKERMAIYNEVREHKIKIRSLLQETYKCIDCKKHCGNYMVKNNVWEEAMPDYIEYKKLPDEINIVSLCLGCLEKRLNRKITINDFEKVPINEPIRHMLKSRV